MQSKGHASINLKYVKCNICGADEYIVVYPSTVGDSPPLPDEYVSTAPRYGRYHDIVKCKHCGLVYMNPRDADIQALYTEAVDEEYIASRDDRLATFGELIKKIQQFKTSGRILDVGTYGGIFLSAALEAGYEAQGIEPSAWAVEHARRTTGAAVIQGTCETIEFGPDKFDLITMWDVIEHLEDPSLCLRRLRGRLKDDGLVFITTHDIGSLFARVMGKRYMWLMRFHLYHFSPATLEDMMSRAGYEQVKTWRFPKRFSLRYLLGRFGIKTKSPLLGRVVVPVNLGDFFCSAFRKKPDKA